MCVVGFMMAGSLQCDSYGRRNVVVIETPPPHPLGASQKSIQMRIR